MFRLLRYLKKSWLAALAAPLFMIVEVSMDLLQPTLMSQIIDKGLAANNLSIVYSTGIKMVVTALIGFSGGVGCAIFASFAAYSYGTELRQAIFNKVQTLSFAELDKLKTSSLVTRLTNDAMQMQNFVNSMLRIMVRAPLLTIGGIIMASLIDSRLALILVVAVPILIVATILIMQKGFPQFREMQDRIDHVNDVIRENLTAVRVVKVYVRQEHEKERFNTANEELRQSGVQASRTMVLLWPFLSLVMNSSVVAALWFGGKLYSISGIQTGQIMAFINYLLQIMFSLMTVAMVLVGASRAKASGDRINEVFDTQTSILEPVTPVQPNGYAVEFRSVSFRYPDAEGQPTLKEISFRAEEGQNIGIIGATGSGKSTLINLLPRLYDATEGEVLIGGVNVKDIDHATLRSLISVALQENILFSGSIEENLRWGAPSASQQQIEEVARDAQVHEFVSKMESGYQTLLGQRGVNLSGGQKQRLAIARAMIKNPKILILDDSTSAVDMATEARIQEEIKKRMGTCTIFIVAQRISSIIESDQILVLDDGRIIGKGTHDVLIKSCEIYRDIVRSQLGEEALLHA